VWHANVLTPPPPRPALQQRFGAYFMLIEPTPLLWQRLYDKWFPGGKPKPSSDFFENDLLNIGGATGSVTAHRLLGRVFTRGTTTTRNMGRTE
jgi:hypothetical protein